MIIYGLVSIILFLGSVYIMTDAIRLRNLPYNPTGEAVARGQCSLFSLSCCGWMPLWPDPFRVPLILTRESSCVRLPNGF